MAKQYFFVIKLWLRVSYEKNGSVIEILSHCKTTPYFKKNSLKDNCDLKTTFNNQFWKFIQKVC